MPARKPVTTSSWSAAIEASPPAATCSSDATTSAAVIARPLENVASGSRKKVHVR
jgi:hypothetical protein